MSEQHEEQPTIVTTYDLKVKESERLWGPVGGPPWARWPQRQAEALPSEYPRDAFDEQTLVDQLVEQASAILHSVDPATRRRVMTRALQQMEADA